MKNKILLSIALSVTLFNFAQTPCENGFANNYPCKDYDLQSHIFLAEMGASEGMILGAGRIQYGTDKDATVDQLIHKGLHL